MSAFTYWTHKQPFSDRSRARIVWVFSGPQGIRAGWGVLIFVAMFIVAMGLARLVILGRGPRPTTLPIGLGLIFEIYQVAAAFAATAVMGWIEGRSLWSYGLAEPRLGPRLVIGWCSGLLCLSVLVGLLHAGGYLAFDGFALHGLNILGFGLIWLVTLLLVGVGEEMFSRGYLLATIARGIGFWPAAVLTSMAFAAGHIANQGESIIGVVQTLVVGLAWCLLLRASGSLWLGIGFHGAWDWAQSYLYGTADSGLMIQGHMLASHAVGDPRISGGAVGPEGSLLAAPLVIAGPLLLAWAIRGARRPHVTPLDLPA